MEMKIKCPDCGKMLKVTIEEEAVPTVSIVKKAKSTSSWLEIAEKIENGTSELEVGDEITFAQVNGVELTVQVAATDVYGGRTAFVLKDCLDEERQMNEECTNAGGWAESEMSAWLNSDVFNLLPEDLKSVIKAREIKQKVGGETFTASSRLWLPSYKEVTGNDNDCDIDDVHFPLFADEKSRVKSFNGETYPYWLRSASGSSGFYGVNSSGDSNYYSASGSSGVALGFLV